MNTPLQHGSHLDADQMNAFVEGVLPEHERTACLAHMTGCARCREIAFLAQQALEAEEPLAVPATEAERVPFWRRWLTPVPLAGVGALACALLVFFAWHRQARQTTYMTQTAELQKTERPEVAATMSAPAPPPPPPKSPAPQETLHPARAMAPPQPNVASPAAQSAAMSGMAAPATEEKIRPAQGRVILDQQAVAPTTAEHAQGNAAGGGVMFDRLRDSATPKAAANVLSNKPQVAARAMPSPAAVAPLTAVASDQVQSQPIQNRNMISSGAAVGGLAAAAPPLVDEGPMHLRIEHGATGNELSALAGVITDASGAVIPNVAVTLYPLVPGGPQAAQAATDATGRFHIAAVPAGKYRVQLTAPGFNSLTQQVELQPHDLARLAPVMPVGSMSETVEVSASAVQLSTESAVIAAKRKGAPEHSLPSNMAAAATIRNGKRTLALDTMGNLFVGTSGKHWKTVKPQWPGKVMQISVTAAPDAFQLTTDSGAVWVTVDGETWRPKIP